MRSYTRTTTTTLAAAALLAVPALTATTAHAATATETTCRTEHLTMSWSDAGSATSDRATGRQETAVVQVKNSGDKTCTLKGHPNVSLTQGKTTETLAAAGKPQPKTVSLAPGKSTQFTLAFLSEKDEPKQAITPDKTVVTPPDNKSSASLPWKWGPVTKQEGATHPGNWVGPIGATVKAGGGGSAAKEIDCGDGWNNLRVQAVTTRDGKAACATAQQVSSAYGKAVQAKHKEPITVTVSGTEWKCREVKGDPNPYQQCVNTEKSAEKVKLLS
ncbi:DUF4232 domain-containing protein [Streptomyces sp. NPDC005562]|uniref:DUF4232 domain-containing protein n=1 Tax=Streptomyces sp. NPDC005562 TaxID=3154890 RepID=UPI0033B8277B